MPYENLFGEDSLALEKLRLIGMLERGDLSDEVRAAIVEWTKQMEVRSEISSKEKIRFNVDRAALCEASKDIGWMFESLYDAIYQIEQEMNSGNEGGDWEELYRKVKELVEEMEAKYPA